MVNEQIIIGAQSYWELLGDSIHVSTLAVIDQRLVPKLSNASGPMYSTHPEKAPSRAPGPSVRSCGGVSNSEC